MRKKAIFWLGQSQRSASQALPARHHQPVNVMTRLKVWLACSLSAALPLSAHSPRPRSRHACRPAPDGEVRLTYASRANVCGDGTRRRLHRSRSCTSTDRWSRTARGRGCNCVHGPARVTLTVRDHEVVALRPRIGGAWPTGERRAPTSGTVPAAEAATYFLSLAPRVGRHRRGANPLLAAASPTARTSRPDLLRISRATTTLPLETRRRAVHLGRRARRRVGGRTARRSSRARVGSTRRTRMTWGRVTDSRAPRLPRSSMIPTTPESRR